jgi:hypothetical protein
MPVNSLDFMIPFHRTSVVVQRQKLHRPRRLARFESDGGTAAPRGAAMLLPDVVNRRDQNVAIGSATGPSGVLNSDGK